MVWIESAKKSSGGNYTDLTNLPQINGITLTGNKTSSDLGLTGFEVKDFTTDNAKVVITYAKYVELGDFVFFDCIFSTSSTQSAGTVLFKGLPVTTVQANFFAPSTSTTVYRFYTQNGYIYNSAATGTRTYHLFGSYIKYQSS